MRNAKLLIIICFIISTPAFGEAQPATVTEPATKTLMWPDGTRYVGGVVDGKRAGKGTIFWQDGTRFVGIFENDQRSGPGTMILPDGTVYNGMFEDDAFVDTTSSKDDLTSLEPSDRAAELSYPVAAITTASLEAQEKSDTMKRVEEPQNSAIAVTELAPVPVATPPQNSAIAVTELATVPVPVTTPPQTAPLYQPITRLNQQTKLDLESIIDAWAAAWSKQDTDSYLEYYSSKFEVPGNQSRSQWETLRRSRLGRPDFINVAVVFEKVEVTGADKAEIIFKQTYTSDRYEDITRKRLTLVKDTESWLIIKEQSI